MAETTTPAPTSMRATWPGTDVIIELVQDDGGNISVNFPQVGSPTDCLYHSHDADIIRKLGFYLPDHSVPAKECGEMGVAE